MKICTSREELNQLRLLANEINIMSMEYEILYNNLIRNVRNFTSTDWKGDDANMFRNMVEIFYGDFNKIKVLMNEYSNELNKLADYHDSCNCPCCHKVGSSFRGKGLSY